MNGKKLLYIEDEPLNAEAFIRQAQAAGYEVMHATNGAAAMEIVNGCTAENRPDAIVIDNNFPLRCEEINIFEQLNNILLRHGAGVLFSKVLKEHPLVKDVPIFMQTAFAKEKVKLFAKEVGIEAVIESKQAEDILKVVEAWQKPPAVKQEEDPETRIDGDRQRLGGLGKYLSHEAFSR